MEYPPKTIEMMKSEYLHSNIHSFHIIASEDIISELVRVANEIRQGKFTTEKITSELTEKNY